MPFTIVRQDITKMKVDAIVNAANTDLAMGGGVCGAIFRAAGAADLQAACDQVAPIQTGEAVITPGFALAAKYVIHTVGPVYDHWNAKQSEQHLRAAYTNSLRLAVENKCYSIAFPLISSGIYGYPKDEALQVATSAMLNFLAENDIEIYLAMFDKAAFVIHEKRLSEVADYIDEHYIDEYHTEQPIFADVRRKGFAGVSQGTIKEEICAPWAINKEIDSLIENLDEPFGMTILRLITLKGKTDVEVYKRANLGRKLFSKIRTAKDYMPSKRTVFALAVALELDLDETEGLLERAGYALSHSQKFDVIVEYFIIKGNYNIFEINEMLFQYEQPLLGAM